MTWENFYLLCFLVGFLLSFVSVLAQTGHIPLPGGHELAGGDAHVGHADLGHVHVGHADIGQDAGHAHTAGHAHPAESEGGGLLEKINFGTVTAFLAWFGGTGYLLQRFTPLWAIVTLSLSALMGLAGGAVVFSFMARLMSRDFTLDPADYDMVGTLGRVTGTVYRGGTGEMTYTRDGVRGSAPIRSEDGSPIEKGEEVVITRYEKGIGYVRRWTDLAGTAVGL